MTLIPVLSYKTVKSSCYLASRSFLCINVGCADLILGFCTSSKDDKIERGKPKLPEEPLNCCMSGCANCVWVAYAEELAKILNDEGETARQKIIEHVKDPNLRAFLMLELHYLFKKKK